MSHSIFNSYFFSVAILVLELRLKKGTVLSVNAMSIALFKDDEKLNYHNLEEVHNGSEAMSAFANMGKLSTKDREKLRHNLLKYCELDTYAMVKIWKKLKDIK